MEGDGHDHLDHGGGHTGRPARHLLALPRQRLGGTGRSSWPASNFLSSSGQIVATFNGQVAPTSCPAQNTCTVTVPPSTSPSAQVVITTARGTSNAVTFTYG